MARLRVDELPASMQRVAAVIGLAATRQLIERFAGKRLYVPKGARALARLEGVIGRRAALAMQKEFVGRCFDIPFADRARRTRRRHEQIAADLAAGKATNEVARRHGVTWRTVMRVKARM